MAAKKEKNRDQADGNAGANSTGDIAAAKRKKMKEKEDHEDKVLAEELHADRLPIVLR